MLNVSLRRGIRYSALIVIALVIVAARSVGAQTVDVFGRTSTGTPSAANVQTPASQTAPEDHLVALEPLRRAVAASIALQSRLNAQLQDKLAEQRNGANMQAAWILMLLSFGYGVLHALGPGHGKLVIGTYLISHRARVGHAVALSMWSACVQAISAICLVGGAAWLAHAGLGGVMTHAATLDLVSYFSLLCVGLFTAWSIVTRRDCCDEGRVTLVHKRRPGLFATEHADDDTQQGAYLAVRMPPRRRSINWTWADKRAGNTWIARQIVLTGLAVGARPCVGAIFVLIAALANGIFIIGVLSVFTMAAGVSLTVLAIGLASLGMNRAVSSRSVARREALQTIRTRFALAGAVFITLFAAWQVFALLAGWQVAGLV
ncbi:high-affinity nickel-transporter [Paraburkholderia phytofirmans PsJN]|uniref:Nickel/cobalt efflux system n=1 Tax=Paraburkholderia phytofirmans (strain DSM 17436 / LMG 22146 / PsJN) TaxID=398527 RepID=B2TEX6_PARPJ|nr:high-affinity nickel-transporter [Paraburkholderia phytofirmans PsJN]